MAAATTATTTTSSSSSSSTTTLKPKRRRFREITISSTASSPEPTLSPTKTQYHHVLTLSPQMADYESQPATYPSSFSNFNSALTAGLLNPMSPPPQTRSSPTLFEMMASEPEVQPVSRSNTVHPSSKSPPPPPPPHPHPPLLDKQGLLHLRVNEILSNRSPGNQFNDPGSSDIRLTLSSKDGFSVDLCVHRQILVAHSRFFAGKFSVNNHRGGDTSPFSVEIADCEDVEVYIETLRLMYSKDLRRKLMREDVPKVLGILKVSSISFLFSTIFFIKFLEFLFFFCIFMFKFSVYTRSAIKSDNAEYSCFSIHLK